MQLYGMIMSGNCWKVAQILRLTGHQFDWIETDTNNGATQTPAFLALNPNGKVPVLRLDDGTILTESNAILLHFAEATAWLPPASLARTRIHEWLFFEQYTHEPAIAVARNLITWRGETHLHTERLAQCATQGAKALTIMERRLSQANWLVGTTPTIADLALFAYTHRADEAGFSLQPYQGVQAWIDRMTALPGITLLPRPAVT